MGKDPVSTKDAAIALLFLLWCSFLLVHPIVLGIFSRKVCHRSGWLWGFAALLLNAGIFAFLESHLHYYNTASYYEPLWE